MTEHALDVAGYCQESANVNVRFAVYAEEDEDSRPLAICVLVVESGIDPPQLKVPLLPAEPELQDTVIAEIGTFGQFVKVLALLFTLSVHVFDVLPPVVFQETVTGDPVTLPRSGSVAVNDTVPGAAENPEIPVAAGCRSLLAMRRGGGVRLAPITTEALNNTTAGNVFESMVEPVRLIGLKRPAL